MADYYPLIARAIAGLDPSAPGQARRPLYERARSALIAQLRSVEPPLSESEIPRERLSLEEAVRKVESEAAQRARDASRGSGDRPDRGDRPRAGDSFRATTRPAPRPAEGPSSAPPSDPFSPPPQPAAQRQRPPGPPPRNDRPPLGQDDPRPPRNLRGDPPPQRAAPPIQQPEPPFPPPRDRGNGQRRGN